MCPQDDTKGAGASTRRPRAEELIVPTSGDIISINGISYQPTDHPRYKYTLVESYEHPSPIAIRPDADIDHPYMALTVDGLLTVKERYAWDGPSGPTVDTYTFIRGSLVHDALYQMLREELLAPDYHERYRMEVDKLLQQVCRGDGMNRVRAWYVYWAVRLFGAGAASRGA